MHPTNRRRLAKLCGIFVWTIAPIMLGVGLYQTRQISMDRAAALEAAADEDSAIAAIYDSAAHGYAVLNDEGRVTVWNRAMERWTGIPASEMLGDTLEAIMPADQWIRHRDGYPAFIKSKGSSKVTLRFECALIPVDPAAPHVPVVVSARVVKPKGQRPYSIALIDKVAAVVDLSKESITSRGL